MALSTESSINTCKSLKSDGTPCRLLQMNNSDRCFWHSGLAQKAQRNGGRLRVPRMNIEPPDLSTPELQRRFIEVTIAQAQNGEIGLNLAKFTVSAVAAIKELSDQELFERIALLEDGHNVTS